ncbi:hypothetical protein PR048_024603 [Dryococelus australis]|uniref:Uncharacterized protein n=1 Tax=Dryococelus australis TaxID=614101 RepID=A0ABQ9GP20_9NEOP|nr:hypothetical protein PR048_024603 [Dryococelus australis]
MAVAMVHHLERRLNRQPDLKETYSNYIDEYKALRHMPLTDTSDHSTDITFYMPHHPVVKESRTSTKVIVVFDASAKSSSGTSLNDVLVAVPTIQQD